MAVLLKEIGDYNGAETEAVEVFKLQPENKEIKQFLESLLNLDANDPNLHVSLSYVYKEIGETEKSRQELLIAKSLYLQLIASEPKKSEYHYWRLAGIYQELQEYENAYQEALLIIELYPNSTTQVESFLQSLPPKYLNAYGDYLRSKAKH